jgi:WD40 repeat protein
MLLRIAILLLVSLGMSSAGAAPIRDKPGRPITRENVNQLEPVGEIAKDVWELAWGPGTGELALIGWEEPVAVLNDKTFRPVRTLAGDRGLVHFTFSRDRQLAAWSENARRVEVVKLATGKTTLTIDVESSQPSLAFTPDGKHLAVGGYGKMVKLFDVESGKVVRTFDTDTEGGPTPVFSPDGKVFAYGNRNSDVRLFETETGKLLHVLPKRMSHELKFNATGTLLAVAYVKGDVALWDPATGKLLHSEATGAEETYTLDWAPKGDLLATGGLNGKVIVWDPNELKRLKEFEVAPWVIRVRFSPDGDRLFAAGGGVQRSRDRKVQIFGLTGQ